ncbi:hypothetical protein [Adhaeribacter soli]|uniref:STAS/SEC14 domain-containing protein n=1 Tax=Adhaeribacter soli TaxID=2607655 RepID=A0A5N1IXV1_9BACT|nr:hypothetical protein [Adhaeribacter soli]KAA9338938.1 hypothetical protein F0P94_09105 [Adhaeribacter soli]
MILYQSSLITLDYDPATDILSVNWPDVQELYIPAVKKEVNVLVETIKHYDVKKLLIDTSRAAVDVDEEAYQNFLVSFARELMKTRLIKLARIGTKDQNREQLVNQTRDVTQITQTIAVQVFNTKSEAQAWLQI